VAGTVGLIYGHPGNRTVKNCAVELGIAMQLTNILRDIGTDYRINRIYLPRDLMAVFGLSCKEDIFWKIY